MHSPSHPTPLLAGIRRALLHSGLLLPLLAFAGETREYHLEAGDLGQTLTRFSTEAGVLLSFDPALTRGQNSAGLDGRFQVEDGLRRILSGSGLQLVREGDGRYSLAPVGEEPGNALEIGATDISGAYAPTFDIYSKPGAVYQVGREQLEQVPYSRPGDIFNDVPGVAAAGSSSGAGLEINIRGMQGMGRVKTLIDGTVQNLSSYKGYSGNRDDTYVDPDLLVGVDIRKGPDAGPQGAGVVGGIVNLRTLNATDIISDPEKSWGLRLRGTYGNNVARGGTLSESFVTNYSNGSQEASFYQLDRSSGRGSNYRQYTNASGRTTVYPRNQQDIGGGLPDRNYSASLAAAWRPLDNWEITLAHAVRESGNYYAGERGAGSWKGKLAELAGKEIYNTSLDSETLLLKSGLKFADDHHLELSYIHYQSLSGFYSSTLGYFTGARWQYALADIDTHTYAARYSWQPDSPWFDFHAGVWKADMANDTGGLATTIETDGLGGELWNLSQLQLPLGSLDLKYGLSFEREDADSSASQASSSELAPVARGVRDTTGSFIHGQWQVNRWLALNAGLQHDRTTLEDGKQQASAKRTYRASNPSYGLVLQAHANVQLFAQWSEGSRAPSLREAFINANGVIPNDQLEAERAENFEYGVNLLFNGLLADDDQLGVKFSRFENRYHDYISRLDRRAMGEGTTSGGRYKFGNIDKALYEGYELSLDYDSGWLFAKAGLIHYDKIEYCFPGYQGNQATPVSCQATPTSTDWGANYVPPRQEKNATLGLRLLDRRLTLGARLKTSTKSLYGGSFIGGYSHETIWDDYEIYDLFGNFQATRKLAVGFSVENLTDRFYVPSYSNNMDALPAPGRTSRVTLTLQL